MYNFCAGVVTISLQTFLLLLSTLFGSFIFHAELYKKLCHPYILKAKRPNKFITIYCLFLNSTDIILKVTFTFSLLQKKQPKKRKEIKIKINPKRIETQTTQQKGKKRNKTISIYLLFF